MADRSFTSSPDPLGLSIDSRHSIASPKHASNESNTQQRARLTRPRTAQPEPAVYSPSKHRQTLVFTTPQKPNRGNNHSATDAASPLRIRVTVEAEHDQPSQEADVMARPNTRSNSGAVLLDDPEQLITPKRKGRPRKSATPAQTSASKVQKAPNAKTPAKRAARPRKSTASKQSATEQSHIDLRIEEEDEQGTGHHVTVDASPAEPEEEAVQANANAISAIRSERIALEEKINPTPTEAQRKIRERVQTPAKVSGRTESVVEKKPPRHRHTGNPASTSTVEQDSSTYRTIVGVENTSMAHQGENDVAAHDDTIGFDRSLAESEDFTMVSIESLRSHQGQGNQPQLSTSQVSDHQAPKPALSAAKSSGIHLYHEQQSNTPEQLHHRSSDQTPKSSAPQVATGLTRNGTQSSGQHSQDVDENVHNLSQSIFDVFRGFGDATRKGLRAGFAMGELLGRNDKLEEPLGQYAGPARKKPAPKIARLPTPADSVVSGGSADDTNRVFTSSARSRGQEYDGSKSYDEMSLEPSHLVGSRKQPEAGYDAMSWSHTRPQSASITMSEAQPLRPDESETSNAESRRPFEDSRDQFRPIENATENEDIWQEEAARSDEATNKRRSKNLKRKAGKGNHNATLDFQELFGEDLRPRRGKIPKTWRRSSGSDFLYSDEADQAAIVEEAAVGVQESPFNFKKHFHPASTSRQDVSNSAESGVQSKPRGGQESEPQSSAQKEVRFTEQPDVSTVDPAAGKRDEAYFSSDDSQLSADDTVDMGVVSPRRRSVLRPSATTTAETLSAEQTDVTASDVLQLRREPFTQSVTPAAGDEVLMTEHEKTHRQHLRRANAITPWQKMCRYTAYSAPFDAPEDITHLYYLFPSLLAWVASWIPNVPSSVVSTKPWRDAWTRNHVLLLHHYIRLSIAWLDNDQPDPVTLNGVLDKSIPPPSPSFTVATLPAHLENFVGTSFSSRKGRYRRNMSEGDVRACWGFILEAREVGIPLLVDPRMITPKELLSPEELAAREKEDRALGLDKETWPKCDETGDVARVKEHWAVSNVLRGVYDLWEMNVMRAEERAKSERASDSAVS